MEEQIILNWPEWTVIVMYFIVLLTAITHDGESKGKWDASYTFMGMIINTFILYFGGFWT